MLGVTSGVVAETVEAVPVARVTRAVTSETEGKEILAIPDGATKGVEEVVRRDLRTSETLAEIETRAGLRIVELPEAPQIVTGTVAVAVAILETPGRRPRAYLRQRWN